MSFDTEAGPDAGATATRTRAARWLSERTAGFVDAAAERWLQSRSKRWTAR